MTTSHVIGEDVTNTSKRLMAYLTTERFDIMNALHMVLETTYCLKLVLANRTLELEIRFSIAIQSGSVMGSWNNDAVVTFSSVAIDVVAGVGVIVVVMV